MRFPVICSLFCRKCSGLAEADRRRILIGDDPVQGFFTDTEFTMSSEDLVRINSPVTGNRRSSDSFQSPGE